MKSLFLIIIAFLTISGNAQVTQQWTHFNDASESDIGYDVVADSYNNVISVGFTSTSNSKDMYIAKYSPNGSLLWELQNSSLYIAVNVVVDQSDNIIVAGYSKVNNNTHLTVMKLDTNGNVIWKNDGIYAGDDGNSVYLVIPNDGYVYVSGSILDSSQDMNFYTAKYNEVTGTTEWMQIYNGAYRLDNYDLCKGLSLDEYGNVYIAGQEQISFNESAIKVIKYGTNGSFIWGKLTNWVAPSANFRDFDVTKIEYFYSAVYVAGHYTDTLDLSTFYFDKDFYLVKYNSGSGNTDWVFEYNRALENDRVYDFVIDENNSTFYLCGETDGNNANSYDMSIVKVDQSGNFVWDVHYNGTAPGSIDGIRSATIDNVGNIYVTGFSQEATGGQDYTTIKYDSLGNQDWKIHYQGGYCQANAICLDYNNDVIITGFTTPSMASSQFRTVKYGTATGITTNNKNFSNVKVFPNPTNGIFIIEGNNIQRIEIKNVNGGDIKDVTTNKKQLEIDLSQYPKGIYLIKVITDKGVAVKKVVLE
ncbi:MAG: hypothetical protein DRJ10_02700 [Bacteroidetes bacterium]|nr:MAG: hypothetical protein DRJ10_02700 [Bacteroidota bacterium]